MEEIKTTVQVRMRYEWQEPNASRLRKPIEDQLLTVLPGANFVNGSVVQATDAAGDFEQQTDFSKVAHWLDALAKPATSYRLWVAQGSNNLDLSIAAGGVNVGIRGEAARAADFRAHLDQFAAAAGLNAIQVNRAPVPARTSDFSGNAIYQLLEDVTADEWLKAVDLLRAWVGDGALFNGNIVLKPELSTTQNIHAIEIWRELVSTRWADLAMAGMGVFRQGRGANLQVRFPERMVNLNLTAEDGQAVREMFAAFQCALKVAPRVAGPDGHFKGERKRYYTAEPITADWVHNHLLAILGRIAAKRTAFGGTFRMSDQEYTVQDFDAWAKEVDLRWEGMQAAGCWLTTADSRHALDVDFEREQVAVELRSGTGVFAFGDYESALNLTPAPAKPYQYFRFARRYQKKNDWDKGSDQVLADAIDQAILAAFDERRRYVLVNSSLTEGVGAQMQTPYPSPDEFLQRLRKGDAYVSARIYLQGPHGYDLEVQLLRSEKKVILRSSIPDPELFKKVAQPFNKIHDLEEYDAENRNAAGEVQVKPSRIGTWMPLIAGLPGFLVAILALFVSTGPKQGSTIVIQAPRDGSEIQGTSQSVEWSATRKTFFHGDLPEKLNAEVLVTKVGDADYKFDAPDVPSGIKVPFPSDGVYDIVVSAPSVPSQVVHVTVKTPTPTPAAKTPGKHGTARAN